MPKLGLTMTEGTITEWVVDAGQKVEKGSVVMLIETDKVEAEVEADADGIVQYVANVGDTLEPGEVVGWLLADEEKAKNEKEEEPSVEETVKEQTPPNQENDTSEPGTCWRSIPFSFATRFAFGEARIRSELCDSSGFC